MFDFLKRHPRTWPWRQIFTLILIGLIWFSIEQQLRENTPSPEPGSIELTSDHGVAKFLSVLPS